jgi:hypothetical protein
VVTPRIGKPVEINALWYNALRIMADFAEQLGEASSRYATLAERVAAGIERFWNEPLGYCYDVLDAPAVRDGHDGSLRPEQLLAVCCPTARCRRAAANCRRYLRPPPADGPRLRSCRRTTGLHRSLRRRPANATERITKVPSGVAHWAVLAHRRVYGTRQRRTTTCCHCCTT